MINLIALVLQAAIPFINFFFKRSARNAEMKQKMFDIMSKYDDQVQQNARLRSEYEKLKAELEKPDK